jgi:hypothetical protein
VIISLRLWNSRVIVELEPTGGFHDFYCCIKLKISQYFEGYTMGCQYTTEA